MSCGDEFLEKNPLDQLSSETFWQTSEEADMALAGVYQYLRADQFQHNDGRFDIMAGDLSPSGSDMANISRGLVVPNSGDIVEMIYTDCYKGIGGCNFFLQNIERTPLSDQQINQYKAEVLFLRGFFYFILAQHYGGVPLYTEPPASIEEAKVARSTKEQVIAQIITDLDWAISNLPDVKYSDGHAVKSTAQALKARVLLHDEQWAAAAAAANEVISGGKYNLHDNFRTLFLAEGQENNPEIIFSTRNLNPDASTNIDVRWSWHAVIRPLQELVDAYECTDGLPITSSPLYDPSDWKKNRDPRLLMTVKAFEDSVVNSSGQTMGFAYNSVSPTGFNPVKYGNWDTLPIDYSTRSDQDWIHIRYADVLLMYAEARNELNGPDASVYDAINMVRARPGVDMPPLPDGLSQEEMRTRIMTERRVEFALEGIRWGDIKRWRLAETYIPTIVDPGGAQRLFDASKHYLLPIPQKEIDVNDKLVQNPNY